MQTQIEHLQNGESLNDPEDDQSPSRTPKISPGLDSTENGSSHNAQLHQRILTGKREVVGLNCESHHPRD